MYDDGDSGQTGLYSRNVVIDLYMIKITKFKCRFSNKIDIPRIILNPCQWRSYEIIKDETVGEVIEVRHIFVRRRLMCFSCCFITWSRDGRF